MLITDISEQKRVERVRDDFFAVASHELRTPLLVVRGNASLIQDYYQEFKDGGIEGNGEGYR